MAAPPNSPCPTRKLIDSGDYESVPNKASVILCPELKTLGDKFIDHVVDPAPKIIKNALHVAVFKILDPENIPFKTDAPYFELRTLINTDWIEFPHNLETINYGPHIPVVVPIHIVYPYLEIVRATLNSKEVYVVKSHTDEGIEILMKIDKNLIDRFPSLKCEE